jgi:hypothetical protein
MVNDHLVASFATRGKKGVRSMKNTEEIWSLVECRTFNTFSERRLKPITWQFYHLSNT